MAYEPETRDWERKHWLYEKYWGEKLSSNEVGQEAGVAGGTIRRKMKSLGIPLRLTGYNRDNPISPFAGFYDGDVNAQNDDESLANEAYGPDTDDPKDLNWMKEMDRDFQRPNIAFGE